MPILIVERQEGTRAAPLPPRLLIGRRSMNHLVIDDRAVSRMHAWIDVRRDGRVVVTDMRSRTGTRVNGKPLGREPRTLAPGDVVEIGPARLTVSADDAPPPAGAAPLDLPQDPALSPRDAGIRFDCPHCRAPMWAAPPFAGRGGICTYCGDGFTIPRTLTLTSPPPPGAPRGPSPEPSLDAPQARRAPPDGPDLVRETEADAAPAATATIMRISAPVAAPVARLVTPRPVERPAPQVLCGVCQSAIEPDEEEADCPSCGLRFHADCWHENYGCSAYGCAQVNALAPAAPQGPADEGAEPTTYAASVAAAEAAAAAKPRTPWEFVLLAASVGAAFLSAVTFGAASLATLVASVVYLARNKDDRGRKPGVLAGAIALSAVGLVTGAAVSYVLFLYGKR